MFLEKTETNSNEDLSGSNRFTVTDDEMKSIDILVKKIYDNSIISWAQIEIESTMLGIEHIEKVFLALLDMICLNEFSGKMYRFLSDSVNSDLCSDCFKSREIIDKVLSIDGNRICVIKGDGKIKTEKFDCTEFLSKVEARHPDRFLKYFLKTEKKNRITHNMIGYLRFLDMVIRRTKIRKSIDQRFEKFIQPLVNHLSEFMVSDMMMN